MTAGGDERPRAVDATEAMRRPHKIRKYGPGENDRWPSRVQPTQLALGIIMVGIPLLIAAWWYLARPAVPAIFDRGPGFWVLLCVGVPLLIAIVSPSRPVDGRTLPRVGRAASRHAARSHGRVVGPWRVHGKAVKVSRRGPKPGAPMTVPYELEEFP